ncbi:hypothetical protein ACQJBY_050780 [Aegilops geniculata]
MAKALACFFAMLMKHMRDSHDLPWSSSRISLPKIPSRVDLLNIGEAGFTGVRLGEGPPSRVAYKTKTDGWMVFNKQWGVFAAATNLQDGAAALFTFQMSNVNAFDIICVATS